MFMNNIYRMEKKQAYWQEKIKTNPQCFRIIIEVALWLL
jgi:hypothetical protein